MNFNWRKKCGFCTKKNTSIQQYIVVTFLAFVALPTILVFSLVILQYSRHTSEQTFSQKVDLLNSIYRNLNMQLQNYQDMTMMLYYENALMNSFIEPNANVSENTACYRFLSSMVNSEKYLSAAVITVNDNVCTVGQTFQSFSSYAKENQEGIYEQKGRVVWLPTQTFITNYGMKQDCFVLARAINSPTEPVGIFWLFISEAALYDNLKEVYTDDESDLLILDKMQHVVSGTDREAVTKLSIQGPENSEYSVIEEYPTATIYESAQKDGNVLVVRNMPKTDWLLIETTPKNIMYKQLNSIQRLSIFVFVSYIIFIILTYFMLSYRIFLPLRKLRMGLLRVSQGDFTRIEHKKRNDEIGELTDSYDIMLRKIEELIKKVRTEEQAKTQQKIKVLSMQIGPHFVYNTLNSIKWLAAINNQPNIKLMVESLIKLMMSVTYNTNEEISLEDELKLLENYCYIQKARYMNFELIVNVPKELLSYKVNKLILQPIVENSILYGFCQSSKEGTVTVSAKKTQNCLVISVRDDGQGFDTSKLDMILQKESQDNQHIGLKNVNDRIFLSHGEPYGIQIESEVGKGTNVLLRLPLLV